MRRLVFIFAIGFVLSCALMTVPAIAHHSTSMYNMANPVTVSGVVKRFEWTNPHAFVYLEVKDEKGNIVEWEVEMMSLNHLRNYGWTRKLDVHLSFDGIPITQVMSAPALREV